MKKRDTRESQENYSQLNQSANHENDGGHVSYFLLQGEKKRERVTPAGGSGNAEEPRSGAW